MPRRVPEPAVLKESLNKVFKVLLDNVEDCKGIPLFKGGRQSGKKALTAILKHVDKGCLSDGPGFSMYVFEGVDEDGLSLYR